VYGVGVTGLLSQQVRKVDMEIAKYRTFGESPFKKATAEQRRDYWQHGKARNKTRTNMAWLFI